MQQTRSERLSFSGVLISDPVLRINILYPSRWRWDSGDRHLSEHDGDGHTALPYHGDDTILPGSAEISALSEEVWMQYSPLPEHYVLYVPKAVRLSPPFWRIALPEVQESSENNIRESESAAQWEAELLYQWGNPMCPTDTFLWALTAVVVHFS